MIDDVWTGIGAMSGADDRVTMLQAWTETQPEEVRERFRRNLALLQGLAGDEDPHGPEAFGRDLAAYLRKHRRLLRRWDAVLQEVEAVRLSLQTCVDTMKGELK